MKLFNSITSAAIVGTSIVAVNPASAFEFRYCEPGTRCVEYKGCYINDVRQPCAYGSGGARNGGIIFDHGTFDIYWVTRDFVDVTYGKRKEYKVKGTVTRENGDFTVYRLSNGVTVKIPNVPGRYNPIGGPAPTRG